MAPNPTTIVAADQAGQESRRPEPELVNHPAHYTHGKYEHIVVAENWGMSANMYCATKYMMRCRHKDALLRDLQKARWYIVRMQQNPWTAYVQHPLRRNIMTGFGAQEVAADWFPNNINLRLAMLEIGLLHTVMEWTFENILNALGHACVWIDCEFQVLKDKR